MTHSWKTVEGQQTSWLIVPQCSKAGRRSHADKQHEKQLARTSSCPFSKVDRLAREIEPVKLCSSPWHPTPLWPCRNHCCRVLGAKLFTKAPDQGWHRSKAVQNQTRPHHSYSFPLVCSVDSLDLIRQSKPWSTPWFTQTMVCVNHGGLNHGVRKPWILSQLMTI